MSHLYKINLNDLTTKINNILEPFSPQKTNIIKNNKSRTIYVLKGANKKVNKSLFNLLKKEKLPQYIISQKNKDILKDAIKYHKNNSFLFKIDIKNFFPSIDKDRIFKYFSLVLKNKEEVANILTSACCYDNHLPQGYNTSPILSMLINKKMFNEINNFCINHNYLFTVYVDDIAISGSNAIRKKHQNIIKNIIYKYGYKIPNEKIRYYNNYKNKELLGVIIKKDGQVDIPNRKHHNYYNEKSLLNKNKIQGIKNYKKRVEQLNS
jgi:RNA-directed DNA polymerase